MHQAKQQTTPGATQRPRQVRCQDMDCALRAGAPAGGGLCRLHAFSDLCAASGAADDPSMEAEAHAGVLHFPGSLC